MAHLALSPYAAVLAAHAARLRDPAVQVRIAELDRGLQRRHMRLAPAVPPEGCAATLLAEMAGVIAGQANPAA